jgi:hypothetical protein
MRKIVILAVIISATAFIAGCKKDKAPDPREVFVATYSVTETWTENSQSMTKPSFTMVLLINFADYGMGVTAEATISGTKITIPQQTLSNSRTISGSGTLSDPNLTFTYSETKNTITNSITATAKKK